jgi:hypothetical protein
VPSFVRSRRSVTSALVSFILPSLALATTLLPRTAAAQSNYRLAPVGGRTTLVGGTGLAYGRDSASAFLNPATVVRVDPGRLAFSVNFYELSLFSASRWYTPGPVDRAHFGDVAGSDASVQSVAFDTLPSSLCIFLRVGDIKWLAGDASKELRESQARLGICLATVQQSDFSFDREDFSSTNPTGGSRQSQTIRQSFRRIAVGPTYAMYVTNALAIGASIHASRAAYRSLFESTATTYGGVSPVTSIFYSSARGDSYDLSATLGATYRIGRYQTVAAALELPSVHLFGPGGLNKYSHFDGAGDGTSSITANGNFAAYTPMRIALGTGIERSWGSAEVNVSYHLPVASAYTAKLDGRTLDVKSGVATDRAATLDLSTPARGAVNFGLGGEVIIAPYLTLLSGVSTDLTTVPKGNLLADPMNYFPARTNRVGVSLGLGSHGDGGDLYLGGELSYSWGERLAINAYQLPAVLDTTQTQTFGLLVVIAGSTSFKAIRRAVNDLSNAVDPNAADPKKKPAPAPPSPAPTPAAPVLDPKG